MVADEVLLARAVAFEREMLRAVATDVVPLPFGEGILTRDLPAVHDHNLVVVDAGRRPDPGRVRSRAEELMAEAGLRHRHVRYDEAEAAAAAATSFTASGYEPYRLVVLAWRGGPPSWPQPARVMTAGEVDAVTRRMVAGRPWDDDPATVEMFVVLARRTLSAAGGRAVGVIDGGEVRGAARVFGSGAVRQIEDVEVLEGHRGVGLGRSLVLAAVHEALRGDPDLLFVVAEDDDWTWRWYERLGFRRIGGTGGFERDG